MIADQRTSLLRYVRARVRDAVLSEDIVQEAFLRYFAYEEKAGNVVRSPAGILRSISINIARDHFRKVARLHWVTPDENLICEVSDPHQLMEHRELVRFVGGVMRAMPALRRKVFILRRVYGYSSREVAERLGLSAGAVDVHVSRAVLDLHRAIDRLEKRGAPVRG